ncbi:hypothetical protein CW304_18930 [Bacillus sp. UFRGS-B20]|nr:hypothetical protein CW304_18930 [Bacillus sp. UFRGS-B20]
MRPAPSINQGRKPLPFQQFNTHNGSPVTHIHIPNRLQCSCLSPSFRLKDKFLESFKQLIIF